MSDNAARSNWRLSENPAQVWNRCQSASNAGIGRVSRCFLEGLWGAPRVTHRTGESRGLENSAKLAIVLVAT